LVLYPPGSDEKSSCRKKQVIEIRFTFAHEFSKEIISGTNIQQIVLSQTRIPIQYIAKPLLNDHGATGGCFGHCRHFRRDVANLLSKEPTSVNL
jgi:hypothetical protein